MGYTPDFSAVDAAITPGLQDKYADLLKPTGTITNDTPQPPEVVSQDFVDPDDVPDNVDTSGFIDPDDVMLNGDQKEYIRQQGPVMEAQPDDFISELKYWGEDFADAWRSGDSWNFTRNMWSSMLTPDRQAMPEFDAEGNTTSVRWETDEEAKQRLAERNERRQNLLNQDSSAVMTAKVLQGLTDPTTLIPLGGSWAAVRAGAPMAKEMLKVGATSSVVAAADSMAYQKAQNGEIDPADTALVASLGFVLGPTVFWGANKAAEAFKSAFAKTGGDVNQSIKAVEEELVTVPPERRLPAPSDAKRFYSKQGQEVQVLPDGGTKVVEKVPPASKAQQMDEMFEAREFNKALKEQQMIEAWDSQAHANLANKVNRNLAAAKADKAVSGEQKSIMEKAFENAVDEQDQLIRRYEQGNVDPEVLQTLGIHSASTVGGATVGGIMGGEEGALWGAAIGAGSPLMARGLFKGARRLSNWANSDSVTSLASGNLWSRPGAVIKTMGKSGRWLAESMERAQQNVELRVARQLHWLKNTVSHLDDVQKLEMTRLLQHTIKPSQASKAALAAAKSVRKELNRVLDEAVEAGIYTAAKAARLKQKVIKNGYFPRVYDEIVMGSSKGKQMWIEAWTTQGMSREGMEDALMSILKEKKLVKEFIEFARVENAKYYLSSSQAARLLRRYRASDKSSRSKHLEASRRLHPDTEKLLEPFLVKDPMVALTRYFVDAHRRIQFSKIFDMIGPDGIVRTDAKAHAAFKRIAAEMPDDASAGLAEQTYYTMVGDTLQSKTLRSVIEMSDRKREFIQGALTYETVTKLGLAQIPNAMQSTINGITKLLNKTGGNPFTSLGLYTKGLIRSLGKEGKEFADLSGAALETTLMELAGEANHVTRVAEKFLKGTGFIAMEKMNRNFAANQGIAYAEWLLSKHGKAVAAGAHPNKIAKLERAMKEIGIPVDRPVTKDDYYRAGLIFSNEINFRHTPDKVPLAWQSPFGKLVTQFKKFAFHQGAFVKENVIKPAFRGNVIPLMWYTAPAAGIGMGIDELRRMIKNDDRELSATERYVRGITMIGGLGLMQDFIGSAFRGDSMFASNVLGPTGSDMVKVGVGAANTIKQGDLTPLVSAWGASVASLGPFQKELRELGKEVKGRSSRGNSRSGSRGSSRSGR